MFTDTVQRVRQLDTSVYLGGSQLEHTAVIPDKCGDHLKLGYPLLSTSLPVLYSLIIPYYTLCSVKFLKHYKINKYHWLLLHKYDTSRKYSDDNTTASRK